MNDRPNGILFRESTPRPKASVPRNKQRETAEQGRFSGSRKGETATDASAQSIKCKFDRRKFYGGMKKLKESIFKSYEELPLFLNAEVVGQVLGVSISSAYELMHERDFPSVRIGNRLIIPKNKFIEWVNVKAER